MEGLKRGAWNFNEDRILTDCIKIHGEKKVSTEKGFKRSWRSCRCGQRKYLRKAEISQDEEDLIIRLHKLLGNRWMLIAGRLPGRTENEIRNHWNTNLSKKVQDLPASKLIHKCSLLHKGEITEEEEDLIARLHKLLGNRWSLIAGRIPGRTENEIKNHWTINLSKKVQDHSIA
ncbi:hypothetical protein GIB67_004458 [Kingdonia uniflora]|uniref:Uncharacterized protein n=1 Tax=Kingdonia uniflora TaxID=39325 RepID=A0A7J7MRX5_9MAGN|nr:hypothetical protein GIB67_004458 [Kingdonia uniflora]